MKTSELIEILETMAVNDLVEGHDIYDHPCTVAVRHIVKKSKRILEIPDYVDISDNESDRNPLEEFIYHNEPSGVKEEHEFREQLTNMLEWVTD